MNVKKAAVPALAFLVMLATGMGGARMLRRAGAPALADSTTLSAGADSAGAGDSTHAAPSEDALDTGAVADSSRAAHGADSVAGAPGDSGLTAGASRGPSAFGPGRGLTSGPLVKPADTPVGGEAPVAAPGKGAPAAPVTSTLRKMLDARTPGTIALGAVPPEPTAEALRLGGLLGKMPPKDAARLLEQMQDTEIAQLLGHLADRQAAQILAALAPERGAGVMRAGLRAAARPGARANGGAPRGGE